MVCRFESFGHDFFDGRRLCAMGIAVGEIRRESDSGRRVRAAVGEKSKGSHGGLARAALVPVHLTPTE